MEIWRKINKFPDYAVSDFGKIKRIKSGRNTYNGKILKQNKNNRGYLTICLYENKKHYSRCIHILIYETFNNYKLKDDECIHHIDGNKENNNIDNLVKMIKINHLIFHNTKEKNPMFDKFHSEKTINKIREKRKNQNPPNIKLKNGEIWLIKKILDSNYYKSGKIIQKFIGRMFNVNNRTISNIKNKKSLVDLENC